MSGKDYLDDGELEKIVAERDAAAAEARDANAVCERWKAEVLLLRAEVQATETKCAALSEINVGLVRERDEAKVAEQSLRDAMYRGHAGMSCKQIAEMADRNIEWCREAQVARDVARDNERAMRKERDEAREMAARAPALTKNQMNFAYNRGCDDVRKVMEAEIDRERHVANLWKALAQALVPARADCAVPTGAAPCKVCKSIADAEAALRAAGIAPDAP